MLYKPELLKKSYETSKKIANKLNNISNKPFEKIIVNKKETYDYDGIAIFNDNTKKKVEFKQRQDYEICNSYYKKCKFPYLMIQADSVRPDKEIYIIYDLTMNYALYTTVDHILYRTPDGNFNAYEEVEKWVPSEKTKIKYYRILDYYIIKLGEDNDEDE